VRKQNKRPEPVAPSSAGAVTAAIARHPREFVGIVMATLATFVIFINALFMQKGPHPAPIFATRPVVKQAVPLAPPRPQPVQPAPVAAPVAAPAPAAADPAANRVQIISDIQRELNKRGFYDGAIDGVWGARTDAAARDFAQAAGLQMNVESNEVLLQAIQSSNVRHAVSAPARSNDPIAALIAPPSKASSNKVMAIQRALADFGYGQIKPTGVFDPATRVAIEKFERDRKMPVTGQISDRFVRELSSMTGRPLE
jgi:peptidoglycan hydrolase-like protein with peptidoglycan-binding domain